MTSNALQTIEKYRLFSAGDRIVAAVSGGADSVALLDFLCGIREEYKLKIDVCHVNHGLRGRDSEDDAKFVEALAKKYGCGFFYKFADVETIAAQEGISLEECGRRVRYGHFKDVANGDKIATAHTLSDSIETLLFNLVRGTGIKGICGIPPARENIIRPLVFTPREDIEAYIAEKGLEYRQDATNFNTDFTRNKIRLEVLPKLFEINPALNQVMAQNILNFNEENEWIARQAEKIKDIGNAPQLLAKRKIINALTQNKINPSAKVVDLIYRAVKNGGGNANKVSVSKEFDVVFENERFVFKRKEEEYPSFFIEYSGESVLKISEYTLDFELFENESEKIYKNDFILLIDYDKIIGKLFLREWQAGDEIRLNTRKITKTLKKLFCEMGLTLKQKHTLPLLCDESGVIGIFGADAAQRVAPDKNTKCILKIKLSENKGEKNVKESN